MSVQVYDFNLKSWKNFRNNFNSYKSAKTVALCYSQTEEFAMARIIVEGKVNGIWCGGVRVE